VKSAVIGSNVVGLLFWIQHSFKQCVDFDARYPAVTQKFPHILFCAVHHGLMRCANAVIFNGNFLELRLLVSVFAQANHFGNHGFNPPELIPLPWKSAESGPSRHR